jgi:hypothetical protein
MILALLGSIGVHLPPYVGLGALADYFNSVDAERRAKPAPVEVSFEVSDEPASQPPEDEAPPEDLPKPKPEPEKKTKLAEKKEEPPQPLVPEPPKVKPPEPPKEAVSQVQIPQPPSQERKQSVTQKSEDPNVEPPPDARYLAEESRRVEEETSARVTSETRDDPELQEAAPQAMGPEEFGEDEQKDERGAERGSEDEEAPPTVASNEPRPTPTPAVPPPPAPEQAASKPSRPSVDAQQAVPAPSEQPIVVQDPLGGSFVLAPKQPQQAARADVHGQGGSV